MNSPEARRPAERWLPLLFLACALIGIAEPLSARDLYGWQYDWRYFQSWIEVGRRSYLWFHQFPLWNPYGCGGEVLLANPQSEVASPAMILPIIFGGALGVKLMLALYLFCAYDGMYRLARDYGLTLKGALFSSVLFGGGGWLALHMASGHTTFAPAGLFPYVILCYRRARTELIWTLPLGALAAWIVAEGGTSTPAIAAVLLGTLAITDAIAGKSARPFMVLAVGGVAALLLGAFRILPAFEFAVDHPRHAWETDSVSIIEMIRNAYWWRGVEQTPGKRYWFHEYGYRLSYLTPPLILWSLTLKRFRHLWIVVLVGAGIVAGSAIPHGPWWLLKHLPIYRDLRVPSRYALLLALSLPLLCGAAFEDLLARISKPKLMSLVGFLAITIALGEGLAFDNYCFHGMFSVQKTSAAEGTPFYQVRGTWREMFDNVMAGHGAIGCDEEAPLQRALTLDEGNVPQVKLLETGGGQIQKVIWTPNRIDVDVALTSAATVVVNQNWNEHWKVNAGQIAKIGPKVAMDHDGGKLAATVPVGNYRLTFTYRPRSFVIGSTVSLMAMPLFIGLWIRRRRLLTR